ncbi:PDR/VanB family oxidoreductase [Pseudoneobacillus rhizosphaerae]|uniref:Carnitine monooxygenase reductase subunit n=1 Tax=Pseudoneobacillus rhizosphaerae TaxID=2880968 RepID=A0A9C7GD47_9BACI|nr:PDR/VanB family oxidoreductase [Pseudoneobacillus rhizosphaerae]CAG9609970.1 Carnitine monooxygenase reductase subunit [Pseudoneobacillus rhizosphaerae]
MKEHTIPVFIKSIEKLTPQVKQFTLSPINMTKLPPFSGGSHIITYIAGENGFITRAYSLTNLPDQTDSYQIAIRLSENSNGGSKYWHESIKMGDFLKISYPKNHFPLSFKAKHHVFYAAGIGITPFLSMMAELRERKTTFELHYASKSEDLCSFYSLIKENFADETTFYFSNRHNKLSNETLLDHRIGTHVYFCGPESFISSFRNEAERLGYPKSSIHFEHFAVSFSKNNKAFQVKLTTGSSISVSKDQTLLEALLINGINAPYSCRVGRCGTCEVKVIEGEIEHNDTFLTEDQKNGHECMLTCVSRAKSEKLVIQLN